MGNAFSTSHQVFIGLVKISEKLNEITAIPELFKLLNIRRCLVTIDGIGCRRIAKDIIDKSRFINWR